MTVASEVNRSGPYTGNGVTTVFNYGFRILDRNHLRVIRVQAGVEALLVIDAHYAVAGVGEAGGGSITMISAPTAAQKIVILRGTPFTQETDLENQGPFFANTVETSFDLAAMRDQQLSERLDRAVVIPVSADADTLPGLIYDITRLGESADNIDTVANISGAVAIVASVADAVIHAAENAATATTQAGIATAAAGAAVNSAVAAAAARDAAISAAGAAFVDYVNLAAVRSTNIPAPVLFIRTAGYAAAGDNGGGTYLRVASQPAHLGRVQSADGAWWELKGPAISPECFGAKGDLLANFSNISTATDNTQPFKDLTAYINAVGGGVEVNFRKAYYKIWPNGAAPTTIFNLFGVRSVTINGNGAMLYTNVDRSGFVNIQVFLIQNTIGFESNDFGYTQTDTDLSDPSHGASFYFLQGATEGVRIRNAIQNGGAQFIACNRLGAIVDGQARVRDVEFSARITNVYYGITCSMSGDHVRGYLRSTNGGRSAILYNCKQIDLHIESNHGGPFDDVEIVAYGHPALSIYDRHTSDIRVRYYSSYRQPGTTAPGGSVCRIAFGQLTSTPTPAFIRNIDINFEVTPGPDALSPIVNMTKTTLTDVDTAARGHQLSNVKIGGYVYGALANPAMQLFTVSGNMTGDSVRNIIIRDLVMEDCNQDININAAGFTSLILENIVAPNCGINVSNAAAGVVKQVGFGKSTNLNW